MRSERAALAFAGALILGIGALYLWAGYGWPVVVICGLVLALARLR